MNKTPPILVVEDTFDIDFIKNMKEKINILSTHPVTKKHYCLIKSIIQYLYSNDYLGDNKFKGIYFHTMKSNDI
jgi:hypothetical protein